MDTSLRPRPEAQGKVLPWQRVRAFAEKHGVTFKPVYKESLFDLPECVGSLSLAPFSDALGINWDKKVLYVLGRCLQRAQTVGNMIHELGHIIACKEPPRKSNEWNFFAWEICTARLLRVKEQWDDSSETYWVEVPKTDPVMPKLPMGDYGQFSLKERRVIFKEALKAGKKYGNVTADGKPISIR